MPSLLDDTSSPSPQDIGLFGIPSFDIGDALGHVYHSVKSYMAPDAPPLWPLDSPVGTSRAGGDTSAGMPSSDVSPVVGLLGGHPVTAADQANALRIASAASQFGPADVGAIKAFHGSPADFNAFRDEFIGTGEGAQTFGYGHYQAGAESTARYYRDALTPTDRGFDAIDTVLRRFSGGNPTTADVKEALTGHDVLTPLAENADVVDAVRRLSPDYSPSGAVTGDALRHYRTINDAIEAAAPKGHMYETLIHADPEHMLDWDKPLSEQSQHVQDATQPHVDAIKQQLVKDASGWGTPSPQDLASYQKQAADIVSRMRGEDLVKHLSNPPYGAPGYGVNDPAAASLKLQDAGIPGIRYLDQGSRGAGEGTSNFVIFDPATIEILRKYGIAGLMAGGGAAIAGNQGQTQ